MSPLAVVVVVVLVDLLGFTMVVPLLGPFGKEYGLGGRQVGLLFAAYPLCQLVAGPVLGRLSDRYGRRPVLVASQAGTALSFLMLGLARDFPTMLLARALDGASGGNILVAQAYVADVTKPADRARGLGLIGMAFGVGFVLGPLMAGLLVEYAPVPPDWRLRLPFLVGAGFSVAALVLVLVRLPESLPADASARRGARVVSWRGLAATLADPAVGRLVGVGALSALAFAALEATYSLLLEARLGWRPGRAAYAFALVGLAIAVVQGGLIRPLVPRFGEPRLIVAGASALAAGMLLLSLPAGPAGLMAASLVVTVGQGLLSPTLSGLLSRTTPDDEQGAVFGTLASAQTLARAVSYVGANVLFARFGPSAPYRAGGAVALLALGLAWVAARRGSARRTPPPSTSASSSPSAAAEPARAPG